MFAAIQSLRRLAVGLSGAAMLAVLTGCATPPKPYDYTAYKAAKPASILVLPPLNATPDVQATPSVWAQVTQPLAESGYYVLPVSLVDETLKSNGIYAPDEAQQIPVARLREIFGADAGLYLKVTRYGSVYKVLSTENAVTLEAKLVDLRSGRLMWEGRAEASNKSGGGDPLAAVLNHLLAQAVDLSEAMAMLASKQLLAAGRPNGLLFGPRSPHHGKP